MVNPSQNIHTMALFYSIARLFATGIAPGRNKIRPQHIFCEEKQKRPPGPLFFSGASSGLPGVLVLLFRGHAAPQVTLGLVAFQDFLHLGGKARIQFKEPLRDIFMNGGLADPEFSGGGPHRGVGGNDVVC